MTILKPLWHSLGIGVQLRMNKWPFQLGLGRMAASSKGEENKKGRSAVREVGIQDYAINIHKHIRGVGTRSVH